MTTNKATQTPESTPFLDALVDVDLRDSAALGAVVLHFAEPLFPEPPLPQWGALGVTKSDIALRVPFTTAETVTIMHTTRAMRALRGTVPAKSDLVREFSLQSTEYPYATEQLMHRPTALRGFFVTAHKALKIPLQYHDSPSQAISEETTLLDTVKWLPDRLLKLAGPTR